MKKTLLVTLILITSSTFAQDKKLSFGLNLFPNLSVPFVVTNSTAPYTNPSIGQPLGSLVYDSYKFSYSANVYAQYEITKRFKLNAGLGYMNNGSSTELSSQAANALPFGPITLPTYNQHHLEIPLNFQLYFSKRFYYTAGISPMVTLLSTVTTEIPNTTGSLTKETTSIKSDFYRTINFYANMGFGIDYIKKEDLALYLQPYVQYGFMGIGKNVPQNIIPFSFGVTAGIRI